MDNIYYSVPIVEGDEPKCTLCETELKEYRNATIIVNKYKQVGAKLLYCKYCEIHYFSRQLFNVFKRGHKDYTIRIVTLSKKNTVEQNKRLLLNPTKYTFFEKKVNKPNSLTSNILNKGSIFDNNYKTVGEIRSDYKKIWSKSEIIPKHRSDSDLQNYQQHDYNNIPVSFTPANTLYIYEGNIICKRNNHNMLDCRVTNIPSIIENAPPIGFYAEYCTNCNRFLLRYNDYKKYLGKWKCCPFRVDTDDVSIEKEFGERAEYSPLRRNGYNVAQGNGLTEDARHRILMFIIDHHILEKGMVTYYLNMFINTNGKSANNWYATRKWEADRDFVLEYKLNEHPAIYVAKIEWYKRK